MILGTLDKQPSEARRITVDFGAQYLAEFEMVTGATLKVEPVTSSPLIGSILTEYPLKGMIVLISGGLSGESYLITIRATTSYGQVVENEIVVNCEEIEL